MKRRTLLRRTGALGAIALAGCTGPEGSGGGTATDTPTSTPTETPAPITVEEQSVRTTATNCRASDEEQRATVAVDDDGARVTVTGSLQSADPCHRAVLETVRYDPDSGTLRLALGPESTEGVCVQCIGTVEYAATVTLSRGPPDRVAIVHDGDTVATASADGTTDGSSGDGGGDTAGDGDAATPVLVSSEFEVVGSRSTGGETDPTGDVEFRSDAREIVVTGTVLARNGCETAMVDALGYDARSDTLSAAIVAEVPPEKEDQVCTQELRDLEYRLTVGFENAIPHTVEVTQDGHGDFGASFAQASASAGSPD